MDLHAAWTALLPALAVVDDNALLVQQRHHPITRWTSLVYQQGPPFVSLAPLVGGASGTLAEEEEETLAEVDDYIHYVHVLVSLEEFLISALVGEIE